MKRVKFGLDSLIDERNNQRPKLSQRLLSELTGIYFKKLRRIAFGQTHPYNHKSPENRRNSSRVDLEDIEQLCDFFQCEWGDMMKPDGLQVKYHMEAWNSSLFSYRSIAAGTGLSQNTIWRLGHNEGAVEISTIEKVCHHLSCKPSDLIGYEDAQ